MESFYECRPETTKWVPDDCIFFPLCTKTDHNLCDFRGHHPNCHTPVSIYISFSITLYILNPDSLCYSKTLFVRKHNKLNPLFYEFFMNCSSSFEPSSVVLNHSDRMSLYFKGIFCLKNQGTHGWYKHINTNTKLFSLFHLFYCF